MKDKISIIIPCYNVEQYIDKCLESIVNQTIGLDMLEIITVNDASTDNTLEKLKEWEAKYPDNIMVISYDRNLRQGGARNVGLQYSTGNYIGYVDSDDWIELNMYEELYSVMKDSDYDIVKCKCVKNFPEKQVPAEIFEERRKDVEYEFEPEQGWYFGRMEETGNCGQSGGIWSGLYKRELVATHGVLFPENLAYEDNYWGAILRLFIKKTYILDKVLYHYRGRDTSTTHDINVKHHIDRLKIEMMKLDTYKELGVFELFYEEIEFEFLKFYYINSLHIFFTKYTEVFNYFPILRDGVLGYFPNYKENKYLSRLDETSQMFLSLIDLNPNKEELKIIKDGYLKALEISYAAQP